MTKKRSLIPTAVAATAVMAIPYSFANVSADATHSWTDVTSSLGSHNLLLSVASSSSGQDIIVGGEDSDSKADAYISHDYGATWTDIVDIRPSSMDGTIGHFGGVDMSSDGKNIVLVDNVAGFVITSTDSGDSWSDVTTSDVDDFGTYNVSDVALSADGSKIILAGENSSYLSTNNSGSSWQEKTITTDTDGDTLPGDIEFDAVKMSADGNTIYLSGENYGGGDLYVLRSDNGGSTWKDITPTIVPTSAHASIDVSDSSNNILLAVQGTGEANHYLARSTDGGTTWSDVTPPETNHESYWQKVELSGNGQVAITYDRNDNVYVSVDRGETWTIDDNLDDTDWSDITLSHDGSKAAIIGDEQRIYLSSDIVSVVNTDFKSATNTDVRLTTPSGSTVTCHSVVKHNSLAVQDNKYQYPLGFIDFCFTAPDENNPIVLTFVTDMKPSDVAVRKYDPNTKQYSNIPGATVTETTLNGKNALKVSYVLQDNGPQDMDPTIGQIKDPVGLGVAPKKAPDTGFQHMSATSYGLVVLMGATSIAAVLAYRRSLKK